MSWGKIVKNCRKYFVAIQHKSEQLIELRLRFGKYLLSLDRKYGNHTIDKIAAALTDALGYTVHPQRLGEYMRVARLFGTVQDIYKEAGTKDITWTDVLILCRARRDKKLCIQIALDEQDIDLLRYRQLPHRLRNDFLKESLRLGMKTIEKVRKLPPVSKISSVTIFKTRAA